MRTFNLVLFFLVIRLGALSQSQIIFSRSMGGLNTGETPDLMIYDLQTKETSLLHKGSIKKRGEYSVTISRDNKLIVNTYKFGGWKLGIAELTDSGLINFRKFTDRRNYEFNASWSYGGAQVAYEEYNWGSNDTEIFIADANGKSITQFTNSRGDDQMPVWTNDDTRIVFASDRSGNYELFLKSVEGNEIKNLTNHPSIDFAPSSSRISSKIAFLSNRTGSIHLYVMDYYGNNLVDLTPELKSTVRFKDFQSSGFWSYQTSWSPDGRQIVFNTMAGTDLELFIVNIDGTGLEQITNNADSDFCPYWTGR